MASIFRRIDDVVFDLPRVGIQAIANFLQFYTSIRPTTVGRFWFVVGGASGGWLSYLSYLENPKATTLFFSVFWPIWSVGLVLTSYTVDRTLKSGVRNDDRIDEVLMMCRVLALVMVIIEGVLLYETGSVRYLVVTYMVLAFYFTAADMLPPSERYRWRKTVPEGV